MTHAEPSGGKLFRLDIITKYSEKDLADIHVSFRSAPEQWGSEPYDQSVDDWALGMVTAWLMGELPETNFKRKIVNSESDEDFVYRQCSLVAERIGFRDKELSSLTEAIDDQMRALLVHILARALLVMDPDERMTMTMLVERALPGVKYLSANTMRQAIIRDRTGHSSHQETLIQYRKILSPKVAYLVCNVKSEVSDQETEISDEASEESGSQQSSGSQSDASSRTPSKPSETSKKRVKIDDGRRTHLAWQGLGYHTSSQQLLGPKQKRQRV